MKLLKDIETYYILDSKYKQVRVTKASSPYHIGNWLIILIVTCLAMLAIQFAQYKLMSKSMREKDMLINEYKTIIIEKDLIVSAVRDSIACVERQEFSNIIIGMFNDNTKCSSNAIYEFIHTYLDGISYYPEYIYATARLESGNGTSNLAKSHNNIIGMKTPKRRNTTAVNKGNDGWAKYSSWQSSIVDRVLIEINHFGCVKPSEKEYMNWIKKSYSEEGKQEPGYWKNFEKTAKEYKSKSSGHQKE